MYVIVTAMLFLLLSTDNKGAGASESGLVVKEVADTLPPNPSRTILLTASNANGFTVLTLESPEKGNSFGVIAFDGDRNLRDARILSIRPEMDDYLLAFKAFTMKESMILGAVDPVARGLWLIDVSKAGGTPPQLILPGGEDLIRQWWVLPRGASRKLFVRRPKFDLAEHLKGDTAPTSVPHEEWLYCYDLSDIKCPKPEGAMLIANKGVNINTMECAGGEEGIYIWQTVYKNNEFQKLELRSAKWQETGQAEWTRYGTSPLVYFTVDPGSGETALVAEILRKTDGIDSCRISFARAQANKMKYISSVEGGDLLALKLVRDIQGKYSCAGLVAPATADKALVFRANYEGGAVSRTVSKSFDSMGIDIAQKDDHLFVVSVTQGKVSVIQVDDL